MAEGLGALGISLTLLIAATVIPELRPYRPVAAGLAAALFVVAAVLPPLKYLRWRYEIRERDLFLSRGAIFHNLTVIPFDRIQYVETRQGPLDRLVGLAQLLVYTAAGKAGQIPGLSIPEAESLRDQLAKIAGTDSV